MTRNQNPEEDLEESLRRLGEQASILSKKQKKWYRRAPLKIAALALAAIVGSYFVYDFLKPEETEVTSSLSPEKERLDKQLQQHRSEYSNILDDGIEESDIKRLNDLSDKVEIVLKRYLHVDDPIQSEEARQLFLSINNSLADYYQILGSAAQKEVAQKRKEIERLKRMVGTIEEFINFFENELNGPTAEEKPATKSAIGSVQDILGKAKAVFDDYPHALPGKSVDSLDSSVEGIVHSTAELLEDRIQQYQTVIGQLKQLRAHYKDNPEIVSRIDETIVIGEENIEKVQQRLNKLYATKSEQTPEQIGNDKPGEKTSMSVDEFIDHFDQSLKSYKEDIESIKSATISAVRQGLRDYEDSALGDLCLRAAPVKNQLDQMLVGGILLRDDDALSVQTDYPTNTRSLEADVTRTEQTVQENLQKEDGRAKQITLYIDDTKAAETVAASVTGAFGRAFDQDFGAHDYRYAGAQSIAQVDTISITPETDYATRVREGIKRLQADVELAETGPELTIDIRTKPSEDISNHSMPELERRYERCRQHYLNLTREGIQKEEYQQLEAVLADLEEISELYVKKGAPEAKLAELSNLVLDCRVNALARYADQDSGIHSSIIQLMNNYEKRDYSAMLTDIGKIEKTLKDEVPSGFEDFSARLKDIRDTLSQLKPILNR